MTPVTEFKGCPNIFFGKKESLPEIFAEIRNQAKKAGIPILQDEAGYFLRWITQISKPARILEIGTGFSYSTHWMLHGFEKARMRSFEQDEKRLARAREFLNKSGFLERTELIGENAIDRLREESEKETYDLIFLDGAKQEYPELLKICTSKISEGGFLIADNVLFRGYVTGPTEEIPKKYRNIVKNLMAFNQNAFKDPQLNTFIFNIGDGILCAQK